MITIDQLKPFYQVIIFEVEAEFNLGLLTTSFHDTINEEVRTSHYYIDIERIIFEDEIKFVAHLVHKSFPSWFSENTVSKNKVIRENEDFENDLVIFYHSGTYLFVYTQCSTVMTLIEQAISQIEEEYELSFSQLKARKMQSILNSYNIQYRTLAISNIYNAGGTAPESKAYYSRNARYCLSPSFDTGFGFNYCLGTYFNNNKYHPFGISSKKSKIWRTWVEDLDTFFENCDELIVMIERNNDENNLQLLVTPTQPPDVGELEVLQFYMDYNVQQKGMVFLEKENPILDWHCCINEEIPNQILFYFSENEDPVRIGFDYDPESEVFHFHYVQEDILIKVIIWNETDAFERKRKTNLIEYLNKQEGFTILLNRGIAYRDKTFWKDNRFNVIFNKARTSIPWNNVDIRREARPARNPGDINILEAISRYATDNENCTIGIMDDGTGEIADIIMLAENRFVLIHAKYSGDEVPGLRVGDVQIVITQALKNLRYFISENYTEEILHRLHNRVFYPIGIPYEDFKSYFLESLNNFRTKKECWIVQPGIHNADLGNDPQNKIHVLLNYVESVCVSNGFEFNFFGS